MLNLKLYNISRGGLLAFDLDIFGKVSLVLGDSATGKTYLTDALVSIINQQGIWEYKCIDTSRRGAEIEVYAAATLTDLRSYMTEKEGALIVVDEDLADLARTANIKYEDSNNYFLIFDRDDIVKYEINVNSVYVLVKNEVDGKYIRTLKPFINLYRHSVSDDDISSIKYMLTEDTASGLMFWKSVISKLQVLEYDEYGSGSMHANIKRALKEYSGDFIIALDYDRASRIMYDIAHDKEIDHSRLHFIPLESFEEIVCNSEFILSKFPELRDAVENYKILMDYKSKSTGKYFSALLFYRVKALSPLKTPKDKNAFKFYSKGMKNFMECFINDCCDFGKEDCKLNYDGSKKEAMLANKFEGLRKFI